MNVTSDRFVLLFYFLITHLLFFVTHLPRVSSFMHFSSVHATVIPWQVVPPSPQPTSRPDTPEASVVDKWWQKNLISHKMSISPRERVKVTESTLEHFKLTAFSGSLLLIRSNFNWNLLLWTKKIVRDTCKHFIPLNMRSHVNNMLLDIL